jgi:hypothetical protein
MMRALDLYSGDEFVLRDALEYLARADLCQFDFLWASPPWQRCTSLKHAPGKHRDADLIAPTLRSAIGNATRAQTVAAAPICCRNTPSAHCVRELGERHGARWHVEGVPPAYSRFIGEQWLRQDERAGEISVSPPWQTQQFPASGEAEHALRREEARQ